MVRRFHARREDSLHRHGTRAVRFPRSQVFLSSAALAAVVGMIPAVHAANVTLNADDTAGNSSFNTAGNWSNAAAPAPGNTYSDTQFTLRTPTDNVTSYTFGGDSLTLGSTSATSFGLLKLKNQTTDSTITVGNLILAGGVINQADEVNTFLAGGITLSSGTTSILDTSGGSAARQITVTAPIAGSGSLVINGAWNHTSDGASGNGGIGTVIFNSANTYTGTTTIGLGALQLANANALQNSTAVVNITNGLTFAPGVGSFTLGGLSGTVGFALDDTSGTTAIALTVGNNNTANTFSGALGGDGSLTKTGTGLLTLTGNNAYAGTTTINSGSTIQVGNGGNSGSLGLGGITNNGTITFNRSENALNVASIISGTGTVNQFGTGGTTLSAVNTYIGNTSVTGGTLTIANSGNVSASSPLVMGGINGAATLNIATGRTSSVAFNGSTFNAGTSNFAVGPDLGGNSLALGAVTRNGGSIVNLGILPTNGTITTTTANTGGILGVFFIPNGGDNPNWAVSAGDGTNPGAITALTNYDVFGTPNGNIHGPGTVSSALTVNSIKMDSNTLIHVNAPLTITTGGVLIGPVGAVAQGFDGSGTITSGGPDLVIILNSQAPTPVSISIPIVGNIGYTQAQVGGATLNTTLTGINTFTGDTNINSGTLTLGANTGTTSLALQNSTLNYLNNNGSVAFAAGITAATFGGIKGNKNLALPANFALSLGNGNQNNTYSGVLSGSGSSVNKVGTGTLTLTTAQTYTGGTTVSGGTLQLSGSGALATTGTINVASGATLDTPSLTLGGSQTLKGGGTITGSVIAPSGAILSPGNGNIQTLSTGSLTLNTNSLLSYWLGTPGFDVSTPGNGGLIAVNGDLTFPASGLKLNLNDNANADSLGSIAAGFYELFSYTGTLNGFVPGNSGVGSFTINSTPASLNGRTFTFTNQNNQIDLQISSAPAPLTWTGQINGTGSADSTWDTTARTNFANGSTPASFITGAFVTFGDTNAANGNAPITNYAVNVAAGGVSPGAVIFTNSNPYTFTSADSTGITGPGGLTVNGTGQVNLQGANSFTGAVAINSGTINASNSASLGATSGVTVASGAALQLQGGVSIGAIPLSISGSGLSANPAGALDNVSGANTYGGTVTLAADATIQSDAGSLTLNAANAITATAANLTLAGAGNGTISGTITIGSGSLTQNSTGTWALNGANTYTGGTTLNAGVTQINNAASLGAASGAVTINAATLEATASITTSRNVNLGSAASQIQVDSGQTYEIDGAIHDGGGAGTLNATGPGTLVLNGANSYSGGTNITAGIVRAASTSALGSGAVTLGGSSPTLQLKPGPIVFASGFGGSSHTGWNLNVGFEPGGHTAPSVDSNNVLTLTTNSTFENRSAFNTTPVPYSGAFTASFVYQDGQSTAGASGMTFTLQNDPRGASAFGAYGSALGYGPGGQTTGPVTPSAALGWSIRASNTTTASAIAGGSNGVLGSLSNTGSVNLASGDPILFNVTGIGSSNTLNVTLTDQTTHNTFIGSVPLIDTLANLLGNSGNAYVGFTGSSEDTSSTQTISNFSYSTAFSGAFNVANNVVVAADSTIDVSYNGGASMGNLSIGSNILAITNASGGGASLTMGTTTLSGNPTFAPASGVRLTLGALDDGGVARTVTVNGADTTAGLTLASSANSFVSGSQVNVTGGTLMLTNTSGSASGNGSIHIHSGAAIAGTGSTDGPVTVDAGATIFVGPTSNTAGKVASVLGIGSGSSLFGSTLLDLTNVNASDEILVGGGSGSVTFGGSLTVNNPNNITFASGQTYSLFGFGSESGAFSLNLPSLPGGLSWNTSALYTSGILSIGSGSGPANLTWNNAGGSGDGATWDVATNQNWNNGSAPATFSTGDNVTFNDNNNGHYAVTLNSTVSPGSVTVDNSSGNYTISGSGGIAGSGGLIKNGSGTLTLSTANTYTGGTTVNAGTVEISPTGSLAATGNVTVGGGAAPAALTIDSRSATGIQPVTLAAVSIQNNGTLNVASPANPGTVANHPNRTILTTSSLSLSGNGSLDLAGNDLIVHNGNLAAITAALQSGINHGNGYWNGAGIRSSAAANDSSYLTTLGVVQATGAGTFDGQTVAAGDVEVKYTYYGDADLSGQVDGTDYSLIDVGFNSQSGNNLLSGWQNGDFNYDGKIDGSDYSLIDNAFNMQGTHGLASPMNMIAMNTSEIAGPAAINPASPVPEPGSLSLLAIGAIGLLNRRRRK